MDEIRYLISDASKKVDVETHVLRYWEEELGISVPRNEMGHRYYTEFHIHLFCQVKKLKDRGYQLKAIKNALQQAMKQNQGFMQAAGLLEADMARTLWESPYVKGKEEKEILPEGIARLADYNRLEPIKDGQAFKEKENKKETQKEEKEKSEEILQNKPELKEKDGQTEMKKKGKNRKKPSAWERRNGITGNGQSNKTEESEEILQLMHYDETNDEKKESRQKDFQKNDALQGDSQEVYAQESDAQEIYVQETERWKNDVQKTENRKNEVQETDSRENNVQESDRRENYIQEINAQKNDGQKTDGQKICTQEAIGQEIYAQETDRREISAEQMDYQCGYSQSTYPEPANLHAEEGKAEDAKLPELSKEKKADVMFAGTDEKMQQFQSIMTYIIGHALEANNEKLSQEISRLVNACLLEELEDYMRIRDEKEEERFRQFDEMIRSYQRDSQGKAEAAAARIPFFRKRKFGKHRPPQNA